MSEVQYNRKGSRLSIAGELTIYQSADFKAAVLDLLNACDTPQLDLAQVSEFDSAGFQILALVRREAAAQGKFLTLRGCSEPVRKVLDTYRVSDWISTAAVRPSRRAATTEGTDRHG